MVLVSEGSNSLVYLRRSNRNGWRWTSSEFASNALVSLEECGRDTNYCSDWNHSVFDRATGHRSRRHFLGHHGNGVDRETEINRSPLVPARYSRYRRRDRGPQILVRIHRRVVDAYFIVQMRSRAPSAHAHIADHLALANRLPICHSETR